MAPVRFRRPRRSREEQQADTDRLIFPPTVYTDATYTEGILIPDARSNNHGNDGEDSDNEDVAHGESITEEVVVEIPENYFRLDDDNDAQDTNDSLLQPVLSQNEVAAWNHQIAPFSAVSRRFPMQIGRLLGTITLYFHDKEGGTQLYNLSEKYCKKNDSEARWGGDSTSFKSFSRKQAINEARLEMEIEENVDDTSLPLDVQQQLYTRSKEIFEFWKEIREMGRIQECWAPEYGS